MTGKIGGGPIDFAMMPRRCFKDKRLSKGSMCILGAICGAVRKRSNTAYIGQEKIAEHAALTRRQVGRVLPKLEQWGYISITTRRQPRSGHYLTTRYKVHYVEPEGSVKSETIRLI